MDLAGQVTSRFDPQVIYSRLPLLAGISSLRRRSLPEISS